jgi:3-deoxy-D-manno-octulosonic-acid transferase
VYAAYSFLLGLCFLVLVPLYFFRLRIRKGEPLFLRERLGGRLPSRQEIGPLVWFHAVSVGEVLSLRSFVPELRRARPGVEIALSALTNTGFRMAREKVEDVDHLFFIPFDFAFAVRKAFRRLKPDLLVLAESEFWPRLLREARRAGCPVLVINGRVSERSFRRMRRFGPLIRPVLRNVTRFLVQTEADRRRLEAAGVSTERIAVAGNLKCETRLPSVAEEEVRAMRAAIGLGPSDRVLIGGSVHRGEEGPLLKAFQEARAKRPEIRFILAPRHPEQFAAIDQELAPRGLTVRRRSEDRAAGPWDVFLLDTIGELARFYALADAAFVGGSLIPRGGQNLLEPAFYGKPVFFGPHMKNFAALAEAFIEGGGARRVSNPEELRAMFLFEDEAASAAMGERARKILTSLQGATARTLAAIGGFLDDKRTN